MQSVTNCCVVSQVVFNSQNDLLHNFTRDWSETDRLVITIVFLLRTGTPFPSFQSAGDSSRFPRLQKNDKRSHDDISQPFWNPGMNPIGPHRFICIQLEQQISNNFRIDWEFLFPSVMVFQHQASRVPGTIAGAKTEVKKKWNFSTLSMSVSVK